jgi:hypothetical protein
MIRPRHRIESIREVDALALLSFAEHILFSEGIKFSTFESLETREITNQTIETLTSAGCLDASETGITLQPVDFTETEYAAACRAAAPRIQEILQTTKSELFEQASKLANEASTTTDSASPILEKWLKKAMGEEERESLLATSLGDKVLGSYNFTICADRSLYQQLRITAGQIRTAKQRQNVGRLFEVLFRTAINEQLACIKQSTYSPAPQRARVVHAIEQMTERSFRHGVAEEIDKEIRGRGNHFVSNLIEDMHGLKALPLPMFAIHYLRKVHRRPDTPLRMLEAARDLREHPEVKEIREWLNKWEAVCGTGDFKRQAKAKQELDSIANDLRIDRSDDSIFTVWHPGWRWDESSNWPKFDPDISGGLQLFRHLLRRIPFMYRHSSFLATVSEEFELDRKIGADLNRMIGLAMDD